MHLIHQWVASDIAKIGSAYGYMKSAVASIIFFPAAWLSAAKYVETVFEWNWLKMQ